ncbi:hypothetical protein [Streptomyces sp. NRRL F-5135]|uniref:hypothetical protein n=1 Tax=Streptomyces sp. NRRL F-5135 TaxID=1463858 RepID=UPI0004C6EEB8|nr:hypothetical protein [Streptomyces sp. NRRL F-5135]
MDEKIRRFAFCACILGGLVGALLGAASAGHLVSTAFGGVLGAALSLAAVAYWSEHGGARQHPRRRAARLDRIPRQHTAGGSHSSHR